MMSPLVICERISNQNTADDIYDMLREFLSSVNEVFPAGTKNPLLFLTDCATLLQSAVLWAFPSANRTSRLGRNEYRNVILVYLLHFSHVQSVDESGANATAPIATTAFNIITELRELRLVVVFLKECSAHVYRAPSAWLKGRARKGLNVDVRQFEDLLKGVFCHVLEEKKLSMLSSLYSAPNDSTAFRISTRLWKRKSTKDRQRLLQRLGKFRLSMNSSNIATLSDVGANLKSHGSVEKDIITVHEAIVDRAMPIVAKQCCAYLKGVAVMHGTTVVASKSVLFVAALYMVCRRMAIWANWCL